MMCWSHTPPECSMGNKKMAQQWKWHICHRHRWIGTHLVESFEMGDLRATHSIRCRRQDLHIKNNHFVLKMMTWHKESINGSERATGEKKNRMQQSTRARWQISQSWLASDEHLSEYTRHGNTIDMTEVSNGSNEWFELVFYGIVCGKRMNKSWLLKWVWAHSFSRWRKTLHRNCLHMHKPPIWNQWLQKNLFRRIFMYV